MTTSSRSRVDRGRRHDRPKGRAPAKTRKRKLIGVVVSDKMNKTRVVLVERRFAHRKYGKFLTARKKYKAHDENNEFKTGDRVVIVEHRPLSRDKRWRVDQAPRTAARGLRQGAETMVQTTSSLDVADNSGAKKLMCIQVLGGTRRKYASLGDVIVVSIKEAIPNAKVKKGDVAKAVIVRTKQGSVAARRHLHPLRRQLGGPHQQGQRADRHAHLRAGGPRAARQAVHEDHLARAGGAVMSHAT